MKKFIFLLLFSFILINLYPQQKKSIENDHLIEKSKDTKLDQEDLQNHLVENSYYSKNPWDFIEKKLMIKDKLSIRIILADIGIFYVASIATFLAIGTPVIFSQTTIGNDVLFGLLIGLAACSSLTVGVLSALGFHNYAKYSSMRYKNLIKILDNYNSDLDALEPNNTKNNIPKELHETFDALWIVYKQKGEKSLKEKWNKIAKLISNKVKFEIKPEQYCKPEVKVNLYHW